jgi:hypothetical protein
MKAYFEMNTTANPVRFSMTTARDLLYLSALNPNGYQTYAGDERDGTEDGRDWQGVLGFVGDLDGTEINVFFLVGEGDAACGKSDNAQDNEQGSDDGCWFHAMGIYLSCV